VTNWLYGLLCDCTEKIITRIAGQAQVSSKTAQPEM